MSQSRYFSMFAILQKYKWDEEEFSGGAFEIGTNLLHQDVDEASLMVKDTKMHKYVDAKDHDPQIRKIQQTKLPNPLYKKKSLASTKMNDVTEICKRIRLGTELRESKSYWQYQVQKWKNTQLPEVYLRMMPQSDRLADMLNAVHGFQQERMLYKEEYETLKKEEQNRLNEFKVRRLGHLKHFCLPITFAPKERKRPLMLALEERIEGNLDKTVLTIVHLRIITDNGLECAALIDFRDHLLREDLTKFFLGEERLIPSPDKELSYYELKSKRCRCNNTSTFIHIKDGNAKLGILLRCAMSDTIVNFDLKITCPKIYKCVIEDDSYNGCVIYDYVPDEYLNVPKPNLVVSKPDDSRVTRRGTKIKTIGYNWFLGPNREAYCAKWRRQKSAIQR